jgi:hypothetical protein
LPDALEKHTKAATFGACSELRCDHPLEPGERERNAPIPVFDVENTDFGGAALFCAP